MAIYDSVIAGSVSTDTATYTVSTGSTEAAYVWASAITVPNGYTTFVVESASATFGNYGYKYTNLKINEVFHEIGASTYNNLDVSSWVRSYAVAGEQLIQLGAYSARDSNIDDNQNAMVVTITYHFETVDTSGTVKYEIGKLYDYNGSNYYQIGKVYDWNGTNAYLDYSLEESILSQFSTSDYYHPNGAYQRAALNSDGSIQFNDTSYISRNIWTPTINLSNYSTLTITYTVTTSTRSSGYNAVRKLLVMANSSNTYSGDFGTRSDLYTSSSPNTTYYQYYYSGYSTIPTNLTAGTTYTQTIDISSWTGILKVGLATICGSHNTLTLKVTSIVLKG